MRAITLITATTALLVSGVQAEQANVTLHSTVRGNQEQPKVMYIVPWQQPGPAEFDYELQNAIAADLFTPVDRDEFTRELEYGDLLHSHIESNAGDVAAAHLSNSNNHSKGD